MAGCSPNGKGDSSLSENHNHKFTEEIVSATCTEDGYIKKKCTNCDYEEIKIIKAKGHDISRVQINATCEADGYISETCSKCDYENIKILQATGHDISINKVDATCTENGFETETCSKCDYEKTEILFATGHDLKGQKVDPTCEKDGYVDQKCTKCNYSIKETLKATGHIPSAATVENRIEPTSTQDGSYVLVTRCSICKKELSRQKNILPATGGSDQDEQTNAYKAEWESNTLFNLLPFPSFGKCDMISTSEQNLPLGIYKGHVEAIFSEATIDEVRRYVATVKANGYSKVVSEVNQSGAYSFTAYSSDSKYMVAIGYAQSMFTIVIYKL